jgi:predicted outer membrane repeat protein
MIDQNHSQILAARTRSGNLLALLLPAVLIPALLMLVLAGGATASAQVVTNTADSGPGTLRSALTNAASGAVITFDPSLSGATITLSNTLTINTNLTIDASALPGGLQINGNGSVQIFNVASNTVVFLNSLTITNGNGLASGVLGGGIYNGGTLTLTNCTLSGNRAPGGCGISNDGTLTLNQCTLSGNSMSGNLANSGGSGIYNGGTLTLNQCTLSGNSAPGLVANGGGIYNDGTATLNQCTLSGNSASHYGGGIYNDGTVTLNQCTLSGNSVSHYGDTGGGILNAGALRMTNTIVALNIAYYVADIENWGTSTTLTYGGSNLVQSVDNLGGTITGPAPLTNAPDLAPLGNYGGPTQTMPPLPGSPAIGAGSVAANTFSTDQRGYPRTQNGLIDLGAVELQSPAANPPVLENITVPAGGGNGLQFTFTNAPAADFTVLTATNVSLVLTNWTVLGEVQQVAPGQYQFTDPQAATNTGRFYRVRSP